MNKILFVFANPNEDLALTREFKAIAQAEGLEREAKVLTRINPDWNELTKAIRNNSDISIFHFAGHAGSNRIELGDFGSVEPIFEKGLTNYLSDAETIKDLQVVFLNGCSTKELGEQLTHKGIPYVISTSVAIKDTVAIEFAKAFYEEFAQNISVEQAFNNAKNRTIARYDDDKKLYKSKGLKLKKVKEEIGFPWKLYKSKDATDWRIKSPSKRMRAYYRRIGKLYHNKALNEEVAKLSDLYIIPDFKIHSRCFKNHGKVDDEGFKDEVHQYIHQFVLNTFLQPNTNQYNCKSENERLLILLGQPGQGKTSFCSRLINDLTTTPAYQHDKNCFFLRLRDLPSATEFLNYPFREIDTYFKEEERITFNPKNSILILDGLDELSMSAGLTNINIRQLINEITRKLENKYKELHVIITSRYNYFNPKEIDGSTTLLLKLNELTLAQQKTWLSNYQKYHATTQLTLGKLTEINDSKKDNFKHIKELINQPILLHLIAQIDFEISSQDNRAAIYTKLFDTLTQHSWNKKGLKRYAEDFPDELRAYISEIAYQIYVSDYEYIRRKDLEKLPVTDDFVKNALKTEQDLSDALKEVLVSFYFKNRKKDKDDEHEDSTEEKEQYALEFMHKSLQEYLVAENLWNTISDKFLAKTTSRRKTKYEVDTWEKALEFIWNLCSHQRLSDEVRDYLFQILQNDTETDKIELADRMSLFLKELLEHQFLWKYDASSDEGNPIEKAATCFYTYWQILANLQLKKVDKKPTNQNYIQPSLIDTFSQMLKVVGTYRYYQICLVQQNLQNAKLINWNGYKADLRSADLRSADLRSADLRSAVLIYADLRSAVLIYAVLIYADLRYANLSSAVLRYANLSSAVLRSANLRSAVLRSANLRSAVLSYANLSYADLRYAVLSYADLRYAVLSYADLSYAVLSSADLIYADLIYADLIYADLRSAVLRSAVLSSARVNRKEWLEDLEKLDYQPKGLEELKERYKVVEEKNSKNRKNRIYYQIVEK